MKRYGPILMALMLACEPPPPPPGQRVDHPIEALFAELDDDGSGSLDRPELRSNEPEDLLTRLDTDGDGAVSPAELRADLELWPEDLSRPARHAVPRAEGPEPPKR